MSTLAEDVLFLSLTDTDRLETLAQVGLDSETIPTEEMRPVVAWAIDRFFESGQTVAPTRAAMLDTWGQQIEDAGIELLPEDEDADNTLWAIETLKAQYVHYEFQQFLRKSSADMQTAVMPDKVAALGVQADVLFSLSMRLKPRHMQVEIGRGFADSLAAYRVREREGHTTKGMTFGLPAIDAHTYGIHEGELAVLAAGPKVGKSFGLAWIAKECWSDDEDTVLFTLENSVQMTVDRIVCMKLGINSRRYQRGLCSQVEKDRVAWFINDVMPGMSGQLTVIMPEPGKRTMAAMVRQTQILGSRRMFIDQLTFVDHPDPGRKSRQEVVRDQMHDLKSLISTGSMPIAAMIAHQINRTGVEYARKANSLRMDDMAESAEVERTADWVFGLHQSMTDKVGGEALFQILAARREELNAWKLAWEPQVGAVAVHGEYEINA